MAPDVQQRSGPSFPTVKRHSCETSICRVPVKMWASPLFQTAPHVLPRTTGADDNAERHPGRGAQDRVSGAGTDSARGTGHRARAIQEWRSGSRVRTAQSTSVPMGHARGGDRSRAEGFGACTGGDVAMVWPPAEDCRHRHTYPRRIEGPTSADRYQAGTIDGNVPVSIRSMAAGG